MLNIIHETKDIIIVNKPAGQLSQGARGFDLDLVSEVMTYNASQGNPAYAAIINRLDRPVSGLVLIAKNKSAASKYSTLMQKDGGFNKQYEALICGKLSEPKGTFVDYLKKDGRTNTSAIVPADAAPNDKQAKLSKLEYEVISYDKVKDITHVRIHLITGRHHQIRVQFASRRHPLVGDYKYAADSRTGHNADSATNHNADPTTNHNADPTTGCDTTYDISYDMDSAVRAVHLKRNQIALCAVSLTVEGKTFSVAPDFSIF